LSLTHGVLQVTVDDLHRANAGGAGRDSELDSQHILTPALSSFGKNVVRNTLLFSETPISVGAIDLDRSSPLPSPRYELQSIETFPRSEFPDVSSPAQQHTPASPSRSRGLSPCLDTSPIYSSSASSGFNPQLRTNAVISGADVGTEALEGEGVAGSEALDSGAALWAASQGCGASEWTGLAETTSHADDTFQEASATSLSHSIAIVSSSLYPASPSAAAAQTHLPVTQQRSFDLQASLHLPEQSMAVVLAAVTDSHLDEKTDEQAKSAAPLNAEVTISSPIVALAMQKLQLEKVRHESQVCGQHNLGAWGTVADSLWFEPLMHL
jgi:hypothetical protein